MSLSWCKVASNLDSHPRVRRAGRDGREVFLFALRRNAEPGHQTSGRLKFEDLDPDYLADILMMPRDAAVTGVRHAVTAGLLAEDGDFYVIVGWEDGWGKATKDGSERTKKWRENKKNQAVTKSVTNVTSPNVTPRHGDGGDALEETRREEKREEKREEDLSGKPDSPALVFAETVIAEINRLARKSFKPATSEKLCRVLLKAKHTPEQAVAVVRSKAGWLTDDKMREHFQPSTLLRASNFAKYLDALDAVQPKLALSSPGDDEPDLTYAGFGASV